MVKAFRSSFFQKIDQKSHITLSVKASKRVQPFGAWDNGMTKHDQWENKIIWNFTP